MRKNAKHPKNNLVVVPKRALGFLLMCYSLFWVEWCFTTLGRVFLNVLRPALLQSSGHGVQNFLVHTRNRWLDKDLGNNVVLRDVVVLIDIESKDEPHGISVLDDASGYAPTPETRDQSFTIVIRNPMHRVTRIIRHEVCRNITHVTS